MVYAIVLGTVLLFFIILILVLMGIFYKYKYNFLYVKVKEADNNLDILLQKKEEILLKIVPILEKAKIKDIPEIIKLKSKRIDHYELYNELGEMTNEILKIIDDYEDKLDYDELDPLVEMLNVNENDIRATIKYYNDNGEEINFLAHKFPANIVKFFSHYESINTYKLQKRETFEILKH